MASAAEQLAANINFSAFSKADELKKRIWFTLGALIVYRLGTYIPLPGIDPDAFAKIVLRQEPGRARAVQHVRRRRRAAHGDLRAEHHALHLGLHHHPAADDRSFPTLEAMKKEGEQGRKVLNQYTRYLTVVLATFQAYGMAIGLEGQAGVVVDPGLFFRLSTVLHADRRHDVPDVARRADHLARHRQWLVADHLRRHRRGVPVGDRQHAGTRPPGRDLDRPDPRRDGDVVLRRSPSSSSWSARSAAC